MTFASPVTLAAEPIKVGIALDISGPFAAIGTEARDGFNLAIEQLNGTLGGQKADFIQKDFAGVPDQALQVLDRFIKQDKITFFTGPIGSNSALAVGPVLFAAKIPYLSNNPGPSQFAGAQCNSYFFGAYQNDAFDEVAGLVANKRGYKNMVLLAPNYPAGKDHLAGFKRTYQAKVADEIYTKVGQVDYSPEIAQIRTQKPDAVFIFLPGGMGINFIKQYVASGLKAIPILAPAFSADQDVIQAVGEPMLGLQNTSHWAHDLPVPANQQFVAAFKARYGGRYPTLYAAQAYDVIHAMDAAVRGVAGKVTDKPALIQALERSDYASVRGKITMGKNHYPDQAYYLRVVDRDKNGTITNRLVEKIVDTQVDSYVGNCKM